MAHPINPAGLDHVVLRMTDVERAVRFYCEVLGCRVEKRQEKIGLIQLRAGRCLIDLVDVKGRIGRDGGKPPADDARNMDHFCIRIEPFDGPAIQAHLKAHGVDPGEVVSRFGAEGDGPSVYLKDPEGNTVELKGPPGPV
jgi:catechol 2,3-dioxygenase-like lactoylglutathione lyase family enzyme